MLLEVALFVLEKDILNPLDPVLHSKFHTLNFQFDHLCIHI